MQEAPPDYNQFTSDSREDGGLTTNTLASHVTATQQYVPTITNASEDLFSKVNDQISSSGTAAAKEMTGQTGHGTMKVVEGIEPTLVDGTQFDNLYFKANVGVVQGSASDNYLSAAISDPEVTGLVEQTRRKKAAIAADGNLYQQYIDWSSS
jgi:hypothetical protein